VQADSTVAAVAPDTSAPLADSGLTATDSVFARSDLRFIPIRQQADWPDEFDAAVVVLRSASGRIRLVSEQPRSESGDWALFQRHRFDSLGRTTQYESIGRYFSECGGIAQATFRVEYDSAFAPQRVTRALTDSSGKEIDRATCGHVYDFFDGEPLPSLTELIRRTRVPPGIK
jgi:hypothetical protein